MICTDEVPHTLVSITRLKSQISENSQLSDFIEPDFGLLDQLLSMKVLSPSEYNGVRGKRSAKDRSTGVLDLLTSEHRCRKFLEALVQTSQQHVVNFVAESGGKLRYSYSFSLLKRAVR